MGFGPVLRNLAADLVCLHVDEERKQVGWNDSEGERRTAFGIQVYFANCFNQNVSYYANTVVYGMRSNSTDSTQ